MSDQFEVARHSKRLVEQQRDRIAALEAECERLRELFKESERHLHHWQGQAAAKGRNVVSMEKERDALRAELAALKATAGGMTPEEIEEDNRDLQARDDQERADRWDFMDDGVSDHE